MMALDSAFLLPSHQSLLDWDQLSFGVPDFHDIISSGMESPSCSDASIEYLQDTITCSRESSKRRKKELSSLNEPNMADYEDLHYLFEDFWNSSPIDPPSTLDCVTPENNKVASDDRMPSVLLESPSLPPQMTPDYNAELNSTGSQDLSTGSKPSSSSFTRNIFMLSPKGNKKKRLTSVVHPFVAVKPAGLEGNVTLEDINQRLLMRPARPVPHPVGEFACAPTMSIGEPGLSGKSVVSLLRIQTRGPGSITIIRTKG